MAATLGRKQLEKCVWDRTPVEQRRDQKTLVFSKSRTTHVLHGNDREIRVFDPTGTTHGSMEPFFPLWALRRRELELRCLGHREIVKLEPPYLRARPDYTSNIDNDLSGARRRRSRRRKEK